MWLKKKVLSQFQKIGHRHQTNEINYPENKTTTSTSNNNNIIVTKELFSIWSLFPL